MTIHIPIYFFPTFKKAKKTVYLFQRSKEICPDKYTFHCVVLVFLMDYIFLLGVCHWVIDCQLLLYLFHCIISTANGSVLINILYYLLSYLRYHFVVLPAPLKRPEYTIAWNKIIALHRTPHATRIGLYLSIAARSTFIHGSVWDSSMYQ